jgi:hypothetical protein
MAPTMLDAARMAVALADAGEGVEA